MSRSGRHPRAAIAATLLLPVLVPGALTAAFGDDTAPTSPTTPGGDVLVAEQVSTARDIVPFAAARPTTPGPRTIWAFGHTRGASTYLGTSPGSLATTPNAPADDAATATVLLRGTVAGDDTPTAWDRAPLPRDASGLPLEQGTWAPSDGSDAAPTRRAADPRGVLHAGTGTSKGAAALVVRITPGGGAPARDAVLARTSDGGFRELPAPPAELVDPATTAYGGPGGTTVPLAVTDAPVDADHPDRGRTAVYLAPAGGDGVLRWDGTSWTEERWEDADGGALGARTARGLAATPTGGVVALLAGDRAAPTADRVQLMLRDGGAHAYRPVAVSGSPLLGGAMPPGVTAIDPVAAPGQPLTVSGRHWWVDLVLSRSGTAAAVHATVHITPPGANPGTGTTPGGSTPGGSTPDGSTPGTSTPDGTTGSSPGAAGGSTPAPTDPSTPSTTPRGATANAAWCEPVLPAGSGCTGQLGMRLATTRGYVSAAFDDSASSPFGTRDLTSPVLPEADGDTTPVEASASGGYLELDGRTFTLRSGVGDPGAGGTQAGVFGGGGFALIGGRRAVGRSMPRSARDTGAMRANDPGAMPQIVDVAVSPAGTPAESQGAIEIESMQQVRRQVGNQPWQYAGMLAPRSNRPGPSTSTAIAWPVPDRVIVAGIGGVLYETQPPRVYTGERIFTGNDKVPDMVPGVEGKDFLDVAASGEDAWAVGLDGAAMHRTSEGWQAVRLGAALEHTTMYQVAYAGPADVMIASEAGLLRPDRSTLSVDLALAQLQAADGRSRAVRSLAALPDGAVVVDGRYVRLGPDQPWRRLSSPAEGDVVATALWRDGSSGSPDGAAPSPDPTSTDPTPTTPSGPVGRAELGNLRIAASIADVSRNLLGGEVTYGGNDREEFKTATPGLVTDGRVAVLGPDGWTDRIRVPMERSTGRDLASFSPPVAAIAADPSGRGWAVGGAGSYFSGGGGQPISPMSFDAPLGSSPFPYDASQNAFPGSGGDGAGNTAVALGARRRQAGAQQSQVLPTEGVRLLIGGHPACLDECAGRSDQGVAPNENVLDAFATADGLRTELPDRPPVMVIGGGRGSTLGNGLSVQGARAYVDLLRRSRVPVVTAIGTGDAGTAASRRNFADLVASQRVIAGSDRVSPVTEPARPEQFAATNTVADAYDVRAGGGRDPMLRLVVVDNADGTLRLGQNGAQAQWLKRVLDTPLTTVVVGAQRLDPAGPGASDRGFESELLAGAGADAYVATDGPDDPADPRFGARTAAAGTFSLGDNALRMFRTSGLGHIVPDGILNARYMTDPRTRDPDLDAGQSGAGLLQLDVGRAGDEPDASVVPVMHRVITSAPYFSVVGQADIVGGLGESSAGTGLMAMRTLFQSAEGPDMAGDAVPSTPTTPETTPGATTPGSTTPEPVVPAGAQLVEARSSPIAWFVSLPCRLFGFTQTCAGQLPIDARYTVDDPGIAVFVRAEPNKKGENKPPVIPTDANGNPIVDEGSAVLCPLRAGRTNVRVTFAGRVMSVPLVVRDATNAPAQSTAAEETAAAGRAARAARAGMGGVLAAGGAQGVGGAKRVGSATASGSAAGRGGCTRWLGGTRRRLGPGCARCGRGGVGVGAAARPQDGADVDGQRDVGMRVPVEQ
ncbi:MAG: hypothetical protein PGN13_13435 [Patulibacter minatonensis]